jgi:TRAP-type C4-dicarboxylate transport system substrate-binding protein
MIRTNFSTSCKPRRGASVLRVCVTSTAIMAGLATMSQASTVRIALGLPETFGAYDPLVTFAETLEREAGLSPRVFAMSLLSLGETPGGVRDGIADIGFVVFPYFPAEYSELNLIANLTMLATTGDVTEVPGAVMVGASMEYTLLNCPECITQLAGQNQVYLGGMSTGPYTLMCTQPVSTVEDMAGRRFRAGAANFARWAEYLGGTTVSVTGNEIYSAMGQGTVDCTMNSVADLLGNRYIDVTTSLTLGAPGGVFAGLGAANVNISVWRGFTDEQRAVALRAAAQMAADGVVNFHEDDLIALEAARAGGLEILDASPELVAATEAFLEQDIGVIVQQFTDSYGVQNAGEKVEQFRALVERWTELTRDIGADAEALGQVYWNEVLSKVDPATYGLN